MDRAWLSGAAGPSGSLNLDSAGGGRGSRPAGEQPSPHWLSLPSHPPQGPGEPVFSRPLHLPPSAEPFPSQPELSDPQHSGGEFREGLAVAGSGGLEHGSEAKGEAK